MIILTIFLFWRVINIIISLKSCLVLVVNVLCMNFSLYTTKVVDVDRKGIVVQEIRWLLLCFANLFLDMHTVTVYHSFSMMTYPYDILLYELSRMLMCPSLSLFLLLYISICCHEGTKYWLFLLSCFVPSLQGVCKVLSSLVWW